MQIYEHVTAEMEEQITAALQSRWVASIAELTDDERNKLFGVAAGPGADSEKLVHRSDRAVGGEIVSQISPIDRSG